MGKSIPVNSGILQSLVGSMHVTKSPKDREVETFTTREILGKEVRP